MKDDSLLREVDVCDLLRSRLGWLMDRYAERPRPIVTLTYAQSIDGCIAPMGGGTLQLSNQATQRMTHQIRALHDGILVGINTVLSDNPQLTVRLSSGSHPQPIVLDSRLRFPLDANLLQHPTAGPIIVTGPDACSAKADRLSALGARIIRVPLLDDGLIDLSGMLPRIKQMGIHSIMVEGGARVITKMLASRIADHLLLAISPRFVGGMHAVSSELSNHPMPQLQHVHYQSVAGDLVIWGHFESCNGAASCP
jgi:3,4-dihydroxy 2-butanone 4-phosphate synthase/GTP cyclohydrolase II